MADDIVGKKITELGDENHRTARIPTEQDRVFIEQPAQTLENEGGFTTIQKLKEFLLSAYGTIISDATSELKNGKILLSFVNPNVADKQITVIDAQKIKELYETNPNINPFTDAQKAKLDGIVTEREGEVNLNADFNLDASEKVLREIDPEIDPVTEGRRTGNNNNILEIRGADGDVSNSQAPATNLRMILNPDTENQRVLHFLFLLPVGNDINLNAVLRINKHEFQGLEQRLPAGTILRINNKEFNLPSVLTTPSGEFITYNVGGLTEGHFINGIDPVNIELVHDDLFFGREHGQNRNTNLTKEQFFKIINDNIPPFPEPSEIPEATPTKDLPSRDDITSLRGNLLEPAGLRTPVRTPALDINSMSLNDYLLYGLASDGTTMYLLARDSETPFTHHILAFDIASKSAIPDKNIINLSASGGITNADDITIHENLIFVCDAPSNKIYAYDLTTKQRVLDKDFVLSETSQPTGIWTDGVTMYVADGADGVKLYAYNYITKNRDVSKEINIPEDIQTTGVYFIWSNGSTIWIGPQTRTVLYALKLATGQREENKDVIGPTSNTFHFQGVWGNEETIYISNNEANNISAFDNPVVGLETNEEVQIPLEKFKEASGINDAKKFPFARTTEFTEINEDFDKIALNQIVHLPIPVGAFNPETELVVADQGDYFGYSENTNTGSLGLELRGLLKAVLINKNDKRIIVGAETNLELSLWQDFIIGQKAYKLSDNSFDLGDYKFKTVVDLDGNPLLNDNSPMRLAVVGTRFHIGLARELVGHSDQQFVGAGFIGSKEGYYIRASGLYARLKFLRETEYDALSKDNVLPYSHTDDDYLIATTHGSYPTVWHQFTIIPPRFDDTIIIDLVGEFITNNNHIGADDERPLKAEIEYRVHYIQSGVEHTLVGGTPKGFPSSRAEHTLDYIRINRHITLNSAEPITFKIYANRVLDSGGESRPMKLRRLDGTFEFKGKGSILT